MYSGISNKNYPNDNYIAKMIRYDYVKKRNYIQFKYYGDFDVLSSIRADIQNDMFYIGNSRLDGSPVFRFYFDNDKILEKLKENDIKGVNVLLRSLKLNIYMGKEVSHDDKSNYVFFNFFLNSLENKLIKYTSQETLRFE